MGVGQERALRFNPALISALSKSKSILGPPHIISRASFRCFFLLSTLAVGYPIRRMLLEGGLAKGVVDTFALAFGCEALPLNKYE